MCPRIYDRPYGPGDSHKGGVCVNLFRSLATISLFKVGLQRVSGGGHLADLISFPSLSSGGQSQSPVEQNEDDQFNEI